MKKWTFATLFLVIVATAIIVGGYVARRSVDGETPHLSRLDTILKSGKIPCSYLIYSPYFRKDPNTQELSGIFHDLMEEVGRISGLKVEWVEEVGYETIFTGLNAGRYDVFAGGLWPSATRAKAGLFSQPVFFSVIKAWGRSDETRFGRLEGINQPHVRIATIDGAMEDVIAKADYPLAKRISLPQLSPFTQNLQNITTIHSVISLLRMSDAGSGGARNPHILPVCSGSCAPTSPACVTLATTYDAMYNKADLTFAEPGIIQEFLKANPGTLKELAPDQPLRIFGNSLVFPKGEWQLKEFFDVALRELLYSGKVDKILTKYEPAVGVFPRTALPYRPETAVLRPATAK